MGLAMDILNLAIRREEDVVIARQRAREISAMLGFDAQDQTRIATAVSEIVRNAIQYGGGGTVEFRVESHSSGNAFLSRIRDQGPGITNLQSVLGRKYAPKEGRGIGVVGARQVMDLFQMESAPGKGTVVLLGKFLPQRSALLTAARLNHIAEKIAREARPNAAEEIHRQNQELLHALGELRQARDELEKRVQERTAELVRANRELKTEIKQRRQAEASVRRMNAELEQRVRERTAQIEAAYHEMEAFSYAVSHDLRAPLRHIEGFAGMLKDKASGSLDESGRQILENISISSRKMSRLINDLLTFARMGRTQMHKTRVKLTDLIQEVLYDMNKEIEGRAIEWRIGSLEAVDGDPAMLRLVLVNLISNAVKYTRVRTPARIEIGQTSTDAESIFSIRDNGVGFEMSNAKKLFGVFQRLHRADEFEGTGIGLANVRRIIERHGGHTWAEGAVNQGATFYFSLPKQPRA